MKFTPFEHNFTLRYSLTLMSQNTSKLHPTLRIDVMSPCILCKPGLKYAHCCQVAGKWAGGLQKGVVETRNDITSILKMG